MADGERQKGGFAMTSMRMAFKSAAKVSGGINIEINPGYVGFQQGKEALKLAVPGVDGKRVSEVLVRGKAVRVEQERGDKPRFYVTYK